jgi:hypothetical protein
MTHLAAPPTSTKTSLQQPLSTHARAHWPQLAGVTVRFRGAFACPPTSAFACPPTSAFAGPPTSAFAGPPTSAFAGPPTSAFAGPPEDAGLPTGLYPGDPTL